jgi:hypothetical protein
VVVGVGEIVGVLVGVGVSVGVKVGVGVGAYFVEIKATYVRLAIRVALAAAGVAVKE